MRWAVVGSVVLALAGLPGIAKEPEAPKGPRQVYRFVAKADGIRKITIRGLVTVDGKDRVIERARTPYEFRCEAGTVVAGYFEVPEPGRTLELEVFDPAYSKRRPAASGDGMDRIRFSWAQPDAGPRCVDWGSGACPDSTPSVEEFRRRLEELGGTR